MDYVGHRVVQEAAKEAARYDAHLHCLSLTHSPPRRILLLPFKLPRLHLILCGVQIRTDQAAETRDTAQRRHSHPSTSSS